MTIADFIETAEEIAGDRYVTARLESNRFAGYSRGREVTYSVYIDGIGSFNGPDPEEVLDRARKAAR